MEYRRLKFYCQYRMGRKQMVLFILIISAFYLFQFIHSRVDPILAERIQKYDLYKATEDQRSGRGERGTAVQLTDKEEEIAQGLYKEEGFNVVASDSVSLDRSLPDTRPEGCLGLTYPESLPSVSIIIIFHNEALSVLLRTVHSFINRTPPQYLQEIILVDDASTRVELGMRLKEHVARTADVVVLLRQPERSGLMRARHQGALHAKGDVLVFVDAHCEATRGWAEPLLSQVQTSPRTVAVPILDAINESTMEYQFADSPDTYSRGGFSWDLNFAWIPKHQNQANPLDPYRSPTLQGEAMAIDRHWYFTLGGFDQGMEMWGGENLELSFKVWQCGGTIEYVPCSHIGHLFRETRPYGFPTDKDYHGYNSARLAEVWMDDYKHIFYSLRPDLWGIDFGNISSQQHMRKELDCKDFKWYLDKVYPEKYVPLSEYMVAHGQIQSQATPSICLHSINSDDLLRSLHVKPCVTNSPGQIQDLVAQTFYKSRHNVLHHEPDLCLAALPTTQRALLQLQPCTQGRHTWVYVHVTGEIVHADSGLCLDMAEPDLVFLDPCTGAPTQKWQWQHYHGNTQTKYSPEL